MHEDCLLHTLTGEERQHFEEQGYLIVEDAVSPAAVDRFSTAMDRLHEEYLKAGKANGEPWYSFVFRSPKDDDVFLDLLDWPTTFPKVWDILGWNIYAYTAHMDIRPPDQEEGWLEWHQDSARVNVELKTRIGPRLSLRTCLKSRWHGHFGHLRVKIIGFSRHLPPNGLSQRRIWTIQTGS